MPPSSRGLGHLPFTEVTGIRIPLGVLKSKRHVLRQPFTLKIFTDVSNSVSETEHVLQAYYALVNRQKIQLHIIGEAWFNDF
jgi:hypothetical protein